MLKGDFRECFSCCGDPLSGSFRVTEGVNRSLIDLTPLRKPFLLQTENINFCLVNAFQYIFRLSGPPRADEMLQRFQDKDKSSADASSPGAAWSN
ncbi:hypothetical protein CDAR_480801 [Caerostris darwini]|uniref:Uncharacterized protein n=1 Tax=Caerostris darwini TaxID=1538125 RepID=A0AAV4RYV1_9ARAC|nr:hypothetical protein CDAR_480801 [Caerostris darwini]